MQLIGKLDSPYVRRVAISLKLLGIPFEHKSISVFREFEQFHHINPVVKAPTFVCDDGEVLMDSTLILDYIEALTSSGRSLMPIDMRERQHALRLIGLALAASEKAIQIYYERTQRPAEKLHQAWIDRASGQMNAAFTGLEKALENKPLIFNSSNITQAEITIACVWNFSSKQVADTINLADYPALAALSARAEALPEFVGFFPA